MRLTYDQIMDILDLKCIPTKRAGYSLNPGSYEVVDLNNTLIYNLPDNMKVSVTIDDVRLKSKLKTNQTLIFTDKSFFHTIFGFTQSHEGQLNDFEGFYQIIPGSYKGDRPVNILGIDNVHLKCDCINGSFVNCVREGILYSFALFSPLVHKIYKETRVELF